MLLTRRRVVAAPSPSPPACPVKADKALFDGIHENAASVHSALNQPKQLEQCLQGNSAAANQLDPDGDRRPLHWAAARGNTKCVELLLHAGGDPCRRCNRPDGGAAGAAAPGGRCSAVGPTDEGWGRQGDSTALCGALARGRCGAVPPVCARSTCLPGVPCGLCSVYACRHSCLCLRAHVHAHVHVVHVACACHHRHSWSTKNDASRPRHPGRHGPWHPGPRVSRCCGGGGEAAAAGGGEAAAAGGGEATAPVHSHHSQSHSEAPHQPAAPSLAGRSASHQPPAPTSPSSACAKSRIP